eukprot:symbB.v1.2.007531.t1/scaffold462.1/size201456/21
MGFEDQKQALQGLWGQSGREQLQWLVEDEVAIMVWKGSRRARSFKLTPGQTGELVWGSGKFVLDPSFAPGQKTAIWLSGEDNSVSFTWEFLSSEGPSKDGCKFVLQIHQSLLISFAMPGLWLLGFAFVLPAFCVECEGQACEADDAGFVQWNGRDRREARRHGREERREDRRHRPGYHHYPSPPPPPPRKPNIFVIIVDDLGFNQVGYRARHTENFDVHTPFIDDLAEKGIKMERFYATPWCAPSRAALQSGRLDALNPDVSNNIWDWDANATGETLEGEPFTIPYVGGIQPGTITLGQKFSELGYVTHLNGKWGIGGGAFANTPMGMGYSSFMGWFGDSMESCDGAEPGFAVGGAGPLLDNLPGFWRQDAKATFLSPWCSTLENLNQLDEEELFVACRSFKAELDDVADEVIRRRSREIIVQHNYHEIKPPDESEALGCLRFCAGGLADLVELRFSAEAQVVPPEAKAPATGVVPEGEEVAAGDPVGVAPKEEKNSPSPEPGEGAEGESYSYETGEEGGKEAAPSTEKAEEVKSHPVPRFGRGSLCKPLGLTPACKSSTRKEEAKPFVFRKDKPARQDRHVEDQDGQRDRDRSPRGVKAKAKAKAKAGILRRPGARVRIPPRRGPGGVGIMRRPGAAAVAEESGWKKGEEMPQEGGKARSEGQRQREGSKGRERSRRRRSRSSQRREEGFKVRSPHEEEAVGTEEMVREMAPRRSSLLAMGQDRHPEDERMSGEFGISRPEVQRPLEVWRIFSTYGRRWIVFEGPDGPLVNGMFGVTKDETVEGIKVYRLIMNLIPLNSICQSIRGDVDTLPSWSMMNPLVLQPTVFLVISSEDVRCFFYTMRVPACWHKYLAFNKLVPDAALPLDLRGKEVYLASRVLPMRFVNSVSLAQHVHRNLATFGEAGQVNIPEAELRKDKAFTAAAWRVYLDNFDVLEKVDHDNLAEVVGSSAPGILALRSQYEHWEVPRNVKKSVSRQVRAEVQGAMVDGHLGVAYPREVKLLKYVSATLALCGSSSVSQRQVQVV